VLAAFTEPVIIKAASRTIAVANIHFNKFMAIYSLLSLTGD
jgi:hypothetical protein